MLFAAYVYQKISLKMNWNDNVYRSLFFLSTHSHKLLILLHLADASMDGLLLTDLVNFGSVCVCVCSCMYVCCHCEGIPACAGYFDCAKNNSIVIGLNSVPSLGVYPKNKASIAECRPL